MPAREQYRSSSSRVASPRAPARCSASTAAPRPMRDALATGPYWARSSAAAFADHGITSQSRQTHSVSNRSHNPRSLSAALTCSRTARSTATSVKKRRPVRVWTMPIPASGMPNRRVAARSSRQAMTTAREPMCFCSHTTVRTPRSA